MRRFKPSPVHQNAASPATKRRSRAQPEPEQRAAGWLSPLSSPLKTSYLSGRTTGLETP